MSRVVRHDLTEKRTLYKPQEEMRYPGGLGKMIQGIGNHRYKIQRGA